VRRLALLLTALALAGCGGGSSGTGTTTTNAAAPPGPGTTLYAGGDWAVVLDDDHATAFHRVAGTWKADTSGAVKIRILGPDGDVASTPQVAAELSATRPLIESGMWVDGQELMAKGGGLTATKGTIYGAPGRPLTKGTHVAVAYARTADHATAVAWSFRVV
jgi:ABC-type glycerol-3-phosphate transport system substrate-binding protein